MKQQQPNPFLDWNQERRDALVREALARPPREAADLLKAGPPERVVEVLREMNPGIVQDLLPEFADEARRAILAAAPRNVSRQWTSNQAYPEGSIGRLMDPPSAVFYPQASVGETVERLRELLKTELITYCYVVDGAEKLMGVITMRDLLFRDNSERLGDIMLREPFSLRPETPLKDAMKQVVSRHYPVYPVCDAQGKLVGLVRGDVMFEEQAFEISAQPGSMVGVEKEERTATPWPRSFKFRHPWLQINLVTAFAAGAVVAVFQDTVDRLVVLATFLPVLAGQSGNTGCQALAVALRGLTLGEVKSGQEKALMIKEAGLGVMNGALTGAVAGLGMYFFAASQGLPQALMLGVVVVLAMVGSCMISGVSGVLVPVTLKRFGADPATASSIFLTTATDIASMGMLLGLATVLVR
ncbi:MAG: magnesium transporter [Betaproteobacteria bacterium]|nr:magnesium transporter [Betaproteobacteria bacterium]